MPSLFTVYANWIKGYSLQGLFLLFRYHALQGFILDIPFNQVGSHVISPLLQELKFGHKDFRNEPSYKMLYLVVRYGSYPPFIILLDYPLVDLSDSGMRLLDPVFPHKGKVGIYPMGNAGQT
jgi:hypothetical protein